MLQVVTFRERWDRLFDAVGRIGSAGFVAAFVIGLVVTVGLLGWAVSATDGWWRAATVLALIGVPAIWVAIWRSDNF